VLCGLLDWYGGTQLVFSVPALMSLLFLQRGRLLSACRHDTHQRQPDDLDVPARYSADHARLCRILEAKLHVAAVPERSCDYGGRSALAL
jgi:hypothetical protein